MDEPTVVGLLKDEREGVPDAVAEWADGIDGAERELRRFGTDRLPDAADGVDVVVAVGERSLLAAARAGVDVPVLPVDAGRGVRSVPSDSVGAAVAGLCESGGRVESHPIVEVTQGDAAVGRSLLDVTLVTSGPAEISEFSISAGDDLVTQVRADGIVVATPAGSTGYSRAVDGPVLAPETGVAAVVPIAPFLTNPDHWAVPLSSIRLTVERETADVAVVVDGERRATAQPGEPIDLAPADSLSVPVVAESRSPFERD